MTGNAIASSADVVISVGCRFTDWSASSYAKGISFSIPPAKLIHIDIDPHEIGKNYPAEVGIVADAQRAVAAIVDSLPSQGVDRSDSDLLRVFLRTDRAIRTEIIEEALVGALGLAPSSVQVDVTHGHVVLSGRLPDEVSVPALEEHCRRVDGVVAVEFRPAGEQVAGGR